MSADKPRRLGRGLEALLSTTRDQRDQREGTSPVARSSRGAADLQRIPLDAIAPNPFQPRRTFTPDELADLERSLDASGLLQPITVRVRGEGRYELVAGERRVRAATRLGWTDIPALVRDFDDQAMLTLALVENLQRANLNPLEEAEGYQRLIDEFGMTQQQVGDAVGKDRTTVANLLRVLSLPPAVRQMVQEGQLTTGHARALLVLKNAVDQTELAHDIVRQGLSVRDAEATARSRAAPAPGNGSRGKKAAASTLDQPPKNPALRRAEEQMRRRLQTDVSIRPANGERGTVVIAYYSQDDLDRLTDMIAGPRSDFD